jgi:hypothetical protein
LEKAVMEIHPYLQHLASADDLVTTYEAKRAGFVALALEKNRQATPFVQQARALKAAVAQVVAPSELLLRSEINRRFWLLLVFLIKPLPTYKKVTNGKRLPR